MTGSEPRAQADETPAGPWRLSRSALERLLSHLNAQPERAAREYESIRRTLLVFFDVRGLADPATLADETIDRFARRLEEGEDVAHPRSYIYGVARNVARESTRQYTRERTAIEVHNAAAALAGVSAAIEARTACLERCLRRLPERSRSLIVDYYRGRGKVHLEGRKRLAQDLGMSYVSLKTRAHRIRNTLALCLEQCLETVARNQ